MTSGGEALRIAELFGYPTSRDDLDWPKIVEEQGCPFAGKKCFKVRKSEPGVSIGTCVVRAGSDFKPLIICPNRFLAKGQVFTDTLHLLTNHEPGNEIHVVSEVQVPGGSVDYFVVSAKDGKPVDFVGVEFQALDTTGSVWPQRQSFLANAGIISYEELPAGGSFGINWKMTAKTILVQLHHKIETFEAVNRKLVLALQSDLMDYMAKEFSFGHLSNGSLGDSLHFHPYRMSEGAGSLPMVLTDRRSTDMDGVAEALSLGQTGAMEFDDILARLKAKMSEKTQWQPNSTEGPEPQMAFEDG